MSVSRQEVAEAVGPASALGPRTGSELVSFAVAAGAHPAVIAELRQLPERSFLNLRSLWVHLPTVPMDGTGGVPE